MRKLKYIKNLKQFESFGNDGFKLSSHEERAKTRSIFKGLNFTDDEWEILDEIMNSYSFKELVHLTSFYFGDSQVYFAKYEDDWYYLLYYENINSNAIVYKCSELEGLIECIHYFFKNRNFS